MKVYNSRSNNGEIIYKFKWVEIDYQIDLYNRLKEHYKKYYLIDIQVEVFGRTKPSGHPRFDMVIFERKKPVCIIELKRLLYNGNYPNVQHQSQTYTCFGCPVIFFYCGVDKFEDLVIALGDFLETSPKDFIGIMY